MANLRCVHEGVIEKDKFILVEGENLGGQMKRVWVGFAVCKLCKERYRTIIRWEEVKK